jgi:hypothetical protein
MLMMMTPGSPARFLQPLRITEKYCSNQFEICRRLSYGTVVIIFALCISVHDLITEYRDEQIG